MIGLGNGLAAFFGIILGTNTVEMAPACSKAAAKLDLRNS